jgi:serine/threonine protein kinase
MSAKAHRRSLHPGDRLADFRVASVLGHGGFGDVYSVHSRADPGQTFAMKVEPVENKHIPNERCILQQLQSSPYFPRFVDSGHTLLFRYMVMECLGPSLSDVRRALPSKHFSLSTSLRLGIEMLRAIQAMHERGFLHRDIKPSNFQLRPGKPTPIALIDFGLARRFVSRSDGELIPPHDHAGFVGTSKYASFNAHEGRELGRRDDVFSWMISLFELITGDVPWVSSGDHCATHDSKRKADVAMFCSALPSQMYKMYRHILKYEFEDEPQYDWLVALMVQMMDEAGCRPDDPFDWETLSESECAKLSPVVPLVKHRRSDVTARKRGGKKHKARHLRQKECSQGTNGDSVSASASGQCVVS